MKLQKFTRLVVERESGKVIGGSIYTAANDDIRILTDDHTMITVNKNEVVRIYLAKKQDEMKSANRGALIGGLIGLAAGMALEAAYPTNAQGSSRALGPFLLGSIGGGLLGKRSAKRLKKGELIYSTR